MENLVAFLESTQNGDGILDRRLIHHYRLETTLERRIFFNVFAVLIQGRRTDTMQFTTRKHRL